MMAPSLHTRDTPLIGVRGLSPFEHGPAPSPSTASTPTTGRRAQVCSFRAPV